MVGPGALTPPFQFSEFLKQQPQALVRNATALQDNGSPVTFSIWKQQDPQTPTRRAGAGFSPQRGLCWGLVLAVAG